MNDFSHCDLGGVKAHRGGIRKVLHHPYRRLRVLVQLRGEESLDHIKFLVCHDHCGIFGMRKIY